MSNAVQFQHMTAATTDYNCLIFQQQQQAPINNEVRQ